MLLQMVQGTVKMNVHSIKCSIRKSALYSLGVVQDCVKAPREQITLGA